MAHRQLNAVMDHLRRLALAPAAIGMTDRELLERFSLRQEKAAFEALVCRHGPMVLAVCRRVLGNRTDAEDAFQATFLILVRKARSIGRKELVGNWLYGVAYRTALKARAATARERKRMQRVWQMTTSHPEQENDWGDVQPLVDEELDRLPEHYRVPVVLCDLEGRSHKEAAGELGCPEGTLSSRLTRARRLLAQRLAARGVRLAVGPLALSLARDSAAACIPPALQETTVQTALLLAAGNATLAGTVPPKVAALTEGVIKAMWMTKLKLATTCLLAICALGVGVGESAWQTVAAGTPVVREVGPAADAPVPPDPDAGKVSRGAGPMDVALQDGGGGGLVAQGAPPPATGGYPYKLLSELEEQNKDRLDKLLRDLLAKEKNDERAFDALFLATLSRFPTEAEKKKLAAFVATHRGDRGKAMQDVLLVLTQMNEFRTNLQALQTRAGTFLRAQPVVPDRYYPPIATPPGTVIERPPGTAPALPARPDADTQPQAMLRKARELFQEGKLSDAKAWALKAQSSKHQWSIWEDSPDKLLRDIERVMQQEEKKKTLGLGEWGPQPMGGVPSTLGPAATTITGRIEQSNGTPLAGVLVIVKIGGNKTVECKTDNKGRFEVKVLPGTCEFAFYGADGKILASHKTEVRQNETKELAILLRAQP